MSKRRDFLKEVAFAAIGAALIRPGTLLSPGKKSRPRKEDSLPYSGIYRIYSASDGHEINLSSARTSREDGETSYEFKDDDINVYVDFMIKKDYILVKGNLENMHKDSRGFIVDYFIPVISSEAIFSNGLEETTSMNDCSEQEGNVFPVVAMCDEVSGVAAAIPPSDPREFGMVSNRKGIAVRFYLGLSPMTKRFPNMASFAFIIYEINPLKSNIKDAGWCFRSALSKYYSFYPDYYSPRVSHDGLWMFKMKDEIPPNVEQYGFDEVEPQWNKKILRRAINRDTKFNILSFPYTIVGMREIKYISSLPKTYAEAMRVYANWSPVKQPHHPLTKENDQGDLFLKDEIASSSCSDKKGNYSIVIRDTRWGGNSVTFKVNPNPYLFESEQRRTVGSDTLKMANYWLNQYPEYDGVYVDSLGSLWLGILNYRKEHFVYAHYPLTFDPQGEVALHNALSHYEYLETLRKKMRKQGRFVMGNGIYAYKSSTSHPEHYQAGVKLGRFFCAALLDVAGSEAGVNPTLERCQDVRCFMGKKPYAFQNYYWKKGEQVEAFVNKSLCYGIFAGNTTSLDGESYINNPKGYLRDKELFDWYVPLARKLSLAGWEPMRYASVSNDQISYERFGHGNTVYYTLYNDSSSKEKCILRIDLEALGFSGSEIRFEEIARHTTLSHYRQSTVQLELAPNQTYIIKIT
jgi:hypothetical protein